MKRAMLWLVGAGLVSVTLVMALQAQERQAKKDAAADEKKEEKIAFTFKDDDQVKEFAQLWQQRQGVLTRMAVLQDYWNFEQAGMNEANKQMLEKYNLDVSKNYTLDTDRKVLLEREAVPPPAEQIGQAPAQSGEVKTQ